MPDNRINTTPRELIERLGEEQDRRVDGIESRVRDLELYRARTEGSASNFVKLIPWIMMILSPIISWMVNHIQFGRP